MLHKYELSVAKEEADKVDTVRYAWEKLLSRSTEVQNELLALQPNFRGELLSNVQTFLEDCQHFYQDYEKVQQRLINSTRLNDVRVLLANDLIDYLLCICRLCSIRASEGVV